MVNNVIVGQFPPGECDYFDDGRPKRTYALYGSVSGFMTQHSREVKFDLMRKGFFGNGYGAIATACPTCNACVNIRVNLDKFKLSRGARKTLAKGNYTFQIEASDRAPARELFDVFNRYQNARHKEETSEMKDWDLGLFQKWVQVPTGLLVARDKGKIIGFSLVDAYDEAVSLEYSAFDPNYSAHGIGTQLWLQTMVKSKEYGFAHAYVGPWAKNSPKLGYKSRFNGLEAFVEGEWIDLDPEKHTSGPNYIAMVRQINPAI